MKPDAFFLAIDSGCWRAARVSGGDVDMREAPMDETQPPADAAGAVSTVLREWGYDGRGVCLGLPSDMIYTARIDCTGLPAKQRRTAMLYRLEEQFPVDIEGLTAAFLPPVGGRALGVAVRTKRVQDIIDALGQTGIDVACICPTTLLALWESRRDTDEQSDYALVGASSGVDIIRMVDGDAATWTAASVDAAEILRGVQADLLADPTDADGPTARIIGELPPGAVERLESEASMTVSSTITSSAIMAPYCVGLVTFKVPYKYKKPTGVIPAG